MQVSQVINGLTKDSRVDVSGWLVIIEDDLYLLDEKLHSDYKKTSKIRLTNSSIIYVLRQSILPLGGGESFVFHESRVIGDLINSSSPEPDLVVKDIFIKEKGALDMTKLNISDESVNAAKKKYEDALSFDFFKEMGDR